MDLEQALAKQAREAKMWGNFVNPIKVSLAKQENDLRSKLRAGVKLDDMELAIAINRGIK